MSKLSSHKCDQCGNIYTRIFTLNNHRRTHFDEKPFKCRICNLSFTRDHDRKAHEKEVHDKRRKFFCEGTRDSSFTHPPCRRLFSRHTSMTRHLKNVKTKSLQPSKICSDGSESDGPADPPVIQFISPCLGSIAGGERIVVTGSSFSKGLTVFFGEVEAIATTFLSKKNLTCETPAGLEPGLVAVTLKGKQLIDGSAQGEAFSFEPVFWYLESQDMETAPASDDQSLGDSTSTLKSTDMMVLDKEGAVVGTGPEMNAADILLNLTTEASETLGHDPPSQTQKNLSSTISAAPLIRPSRSTSSDSMAVVYVCGIFQGRQFGAVAPMLTLFLQRSVDGANFYSTPSDKQNFARHMLNEKAMVRLMADSFYGVPSTEEFWPLTEELDVCCYSLSTGELIWKVGDLVEACRKVLPVLQLSWGIKDSIWVQTLGRRLNEALAQMTRGQRPTSLFSEAAGMQKI